jgi:signal transduction histidine kinase
VQDHGIGIPANQQGNIFERFFRVSGEKENTYAGLGLGLYISSELIKRHNGTIGVESEIGDGSTFYFTIPVAS